MELPGGNGFLELRVVPDDNSCLFSAIGVVFLGGIESAGELRGVVVDAIRNNPDTYSEVMLGYVFFCFPPRLMTYPLLFILGTVHI